MGIVVEGKTGALALIGVLSTFILTWRWLGLYEKSDVILMISAVVLIASLSALIISMEERIRALEERVDRTERSLRVTVHGMEEILEDQINRSNSRVLELLEKIEKRLYR